MVPPNSAHVNWWTSNQTTHAQTVSTNSQPHLKSSNTGPYHFHYPFSSLNILWLKQAVISSLNSTQDETDENNHYHYLKNILNVWVPPDLLPMIPLVLSNTLMH